MVGVNVLYFIFLCYRGRTINNIKSCELCERTNKIVSIYYREFVSVKIRLEMCGVYVTRYGIKASGIRLLLFCTLYNVVLNERRSKKEMSK